MDMVSEKGLVKVFVAMKKLLLWQQTLTYLTLLDSFSFGVENTMISCETVASLSTMLVAI